MRVGTDEEGGREKGRGGRSRGSRMMTRCKKGWHRRGRGAFVAGTEPSYGGGHTTQKTRRSKPTDFKGARGSSAADRRLQGKICAAKPKRQGLQGLLLPLGRGREMADDGIFATGPRKLRQGYLVLLGLVPPLAGGAQGSLEITHSAGAYLDPIVPG